MWANMVEAYNRCRTTTDRRPGARHSIEASFAPRCRSKSGALKAQFPDAEHPSCARTSSGKKAPFVNAFDPLQQLPHGGQRGPGRLQSAPASFRTI
jgi:hypothetical protein